MSVALNINEQAQPLDFVPTNIEAIKKAFIQIHQTQPLAANEQLIRPAASAEHVLQVKDWVQDLERELGIKARVLSTSSKVNTYVAAPAAVINNEPVLFANYTDNQKLALDAFEYVVVGLLGIQRLMSDSKIYLRIFNDLDMDTKEYMAKRNELNLDKPTHQELLVKLYLANLASLNIKLTWLERREAWQRQLVRMVYPKLKMGSLDLHYLLLKARRKIRKEHK